jgi:vacuolar-type H+-ATPase subunit H
LKEADDKITTAKEQASKIISDAEKKAEEVKNAALKKDADLTVRMSARSTELTNLEVKVQDAQTKLENLNAELARIKAMV